MYATESPSTATITDDGIITAISPGTTNITVASADGHVTVTLPVYVIASWEEENMTFHSPLLTSGNYIKGLDYTNTTVSWIQDHITTSYTLEFYNPQGEILQNTDTVGTECTMHVYDHNHVLQYVYTFLLYGDVNGDGKINSTDLLVLQRHILEIEKLQGSFLISGNLSKNGKNPSSLDSLLIQRHILEFSMINQS